MKKNLQSIVRILCLAGLAMGLANAQATYPLTSSACGTNTYGACFIYQSPSTDFYLNWNTNGTVTVTQYAVNTGGTITVLAHYGAVLTYNPLGGINDAVLTNSDGSATDIILHATFVSRRTCTTSGRGQHCTTYVSLTGGTLIQ